MKDACRKGNPLPASAWGKVSRELGLLFGGNRQGGSWMLPVWVAEKRDSDPS